jgi:hypothetical protein
LSNIQKVKESVVTYGPPNGVRLRAIATVDFRKSEAANLAEFLRATAMHLRPGEVVLFRSQSGNQLLFVSDYRQIEGPLGAREVLQSVRLRLRGTREPRLLAAYAEQARLRIDGLDRFERFYRRELRA